MDIMLASLVPCDKNYYKAQLAICKYCMYLDVDKNNEGFNDSFKMRLQITLHTDSR